MSATYFKRYRMQIGLEGLTHEPRLPDGYRFVPWRPELCQVHADTKFQSFRDELDANVFACLGDAVGCLRLMQEIARKEGFVPEATWLAWHEPSGEYCGTIQGICDAAGYGSVQNLGVVPRHRGLGLGTALLLRALDGFQAAGLRQAYLEVTAQNSGAVRLYERLGFVRTRTVYKAVEIAPAAVW